ncbi:MAG: right-handed parallel beta-helix repeat-containing protein [Myxococcales bacterium]
MALVACGGGAGAGGTSATGSATAGAGTGGSSGGEGTTGPGGSDGTGTTGGGSGTGSTNGTGTAGGSTTGRSVGSNSGGASSSSAGSSGGSGSTGGLAACGGFDAGFNSGYTCPAGAVSVAPDASLAPLVKSNPPGTTFCLQPGTHHDSVLLRTGGGGDVFTGPTGSLADGVIESGGVALAGWSQVTVAGTAYWTAAAGPPLTTVQNDTVCGDVPAGGSTCSGYETCFFPQALYVDGGTYLAVSSLSAVAPGSWYYEMDGLQSVKIAAGGGGYTLGDELDVAGGDAGLVKVSGVDDAGAVTGLAIIRPGYGYPASIASAATAEARIGFPGPRDAGTGSGCTLSLSAGCGGTFGNVYLAASEAPAAAVVEIGTLPYFLATAEASGVVVQGLTIQEYAGDIGGAAVEMNWEGSSGTASGWTIQNDEVRLNQSIGVYVGYGPDGGPMALVQGNHLHHNGQFGLGGGGNLAPITVRGNTIDHNNTAHVCPDYGAGGLKVGGTKAPVLVEGNVVHDDRGGGLWSDVNARDVTYQCNTVHDELDEGIRIEVSAAQAVLDNQLYGCGQDPIHVTCSSQVTVEGNYVVPGPGAVGLAVDYSHKRDGEHPGFTEPAGLSVVQNTVLVSGTHGGATLWDFSSPHDLSWQDAGIFDGNSYCADAGSWSGWGKGDGFAWGDFSAWQTGASPQDPHGQLLLNGSCPLP